MTIEHTSEFLGIPSLEYDKMERGVIPFVPAMYERLMTFLERGMCGHCMHFYTVERAMGMGICELNKHTEYNNIGARKLACLKWKERIY